MGDDDDGADSVDVWAIAHAALADDLDVTVRHAAIERAHEASQP